MPASSSGSSRDAQDCVEVVRMTPDRADDAWLLLNEYYAEVGIIERDTPASVQRFLSSVDSGFWMAYVGVTPAGCVGLRPLQGISAAGECKRLYVRRRFRRRGIAAALLDTWKGTHGIYP